MQGEDLVAVRDQLWDDLNDGAVKLRFNGFTLTADPFLMIGGTEYVPPDYSDDEDEEYEEEEDEDIHVPFIPAVLTINIRRGG